MTLPSPQSRLSRVRTLARALDSAVAIPGTGIRMGLDPLLGLIPGIGDMAGAALSGYIVLTGLQLGAPRAVVVRMLGNIAIDTLVGSVPIVGDLFDVGWKSNDRNVALLERHLDEPGQVRRSSRWMLVAVAATLALLAIGGALLTFAVLRELAHLVTSR